MHVKPLKTLAFDTETKLIGPALLAPPLVCVTWQMEGEKEPHIVHHKDAEPLLRSWLSDRTLRLVGAHMAFDMSVVAEAFPHLVPLIFAAYDDNRVTDVLIRQKLLDIAAGVFRGRLVGKGVWIPYEYNLERVAKRCAGIELQKDEWRLLYGEFIDLPLTQWVEKAKLLQIEAGPRLVNFEREFEATAKKEQKKRKALQKVITGIRDMVASLPEQCLRYPLEDARATLATFFAQEKHASYLDDQYRQTYAALALSLSSAWGLRTDALGVEVLRRETLARLEDNEIDLQEAGLVRENGVRDTKAAKARMVLICEREGLTLRRTDAHANPDAKCKALDGTTLEPGHKDCVEHVSLDRDACEATGDWLLEAYAELSTDKKILSNDVVALEGGIAWPIHTRYDLAETGRTTSSKPNIQNWARGRRCRVCDGKGEVAA